MMTDEERTIWAAAYGAAFAIHSLMNKYDDKKADYYARNVGDRAVMAHEANTPKKPAARAGKGRKG